MTTKSVSHAAALLSISSREKQYSHMTKEEKSEYFRKLRVNNMPGNNLFKHVCRPCGYKWESKVEYPKQCAFCKRYNWNKEKTE
jgi:rubrerythrin